MRRLLSVVILTKNEEENIIDCIESVKFADEIIIIDDYSTDRTVELVEHLADPKIKIFKYHLENNFSKARNYGLSKASCAWTLFIDADERVGKDLREEILQELLNSDKHDIKGYSIPRRDFMWGKMLEHGEVGHMKLLRLARSEAGKWIGKVHEEWRIEGDIVDLNNFIKHYPHQTVKEFLNDINSYTNLRADELHTQRVRVSWFSIILYPFLKFVVNYFIKQGYKDGLAGFIHAIIMSFHSFLVRSKLYFLRNRIQ